MADCVATIAGRLGRPLPDDFCIRLARARTAEAFRHELSSHSRAFHDALESN